MGWRKYFERYGDYVKKEFDYYDFDFGWFISQTFRHNKEELHRLFLGFYSIVEGFLYLYDDLAEMILLAGKNPPKEETKQIRELEESYEDFLNALRELRDEDEEIRKLFKEDSSLLKPRAKLSNIHSPKH